MFILILFYFRLEVICFYKALVGLIGVYRRIIVIIISNEIIIVEGSVIFYGRFNLYIVCNF